MGKLDTNTVVPVGVVCAVVLAIITVVSSYTKLEAQVTAQAADMSRQATYIKEGSERQDRFDQMIGKISEDMSYMRGVLQRLDRRGRMDRQ